MTRIGNILAWLSRLPTTTYAIAAIASVLTTMVWAHTRARDRAFARGQQDMADRARVQFIADSLRALRADTVTQEKQKAADSARTVTRSRIASVDSQAIIAAALAQQLPPSLDTIPQVVELKASVLSLAQSVQTLSSDYATLDSAAMAERAAHRYELTLTQSQLSASRIIVVSLTDSVAVLEKRPRWRTVAKVGVAALSGGVAIGKWVLPRVL